MKLFLCVAGCLVLGMLGGLFTQESVDTWYPTLVKPSWNPPTWVFPLVWTMLYTLMGVALWLVITSQTSYRGSAYLFFALQFFLNFIWSFLFFGLENPLFALIDILLLWVAIVLTISHFQPHSRMAAWLLVPYLIWVTYAVSLNVYIWLNNPPIA